MKTRKQAVTLDNPEIHAGFLVDFPTLQLVGLFALFWTNIYDVHHLDS